MESSEKEKKRGLDTSANSPSLWQSTFSKDSSSTDGVLSKKTKLEHSSSESDGDLSPSWDSNTPSYAAFMAPRDEPQQSTEDGEANAYSSFAKRQLESMGYKSGEGLGKYGQGRREILEASKQKGRRGLGFSVRGFDDSEVLGWTEDKVQIVEPREFIPSCSLPPLTMNEMKTWIVIGEKNPTIERETQFCDEEVLKDILSSKSVFDALSGDEFLRARTRANPYELIRGAIFLNRAAMKMANMDSAFDFMFTSPKNEKGEDLVKPNELLYFADLCAGPGGFSEYVLWRKTWHAKGFGFTLKGDNDFKLENFLAGSPETFQPHYGKDDDGDIFKEDNLEEFKAFVLKETDGKGVHFVMADGGFSVEGQENIQEILSKQLYLCQFLMAILILRTGGHFLCKVFDLFTPFSIGLVYLMYRAFDEVCIFKPITSRPANSERYLVCKGLRRGVTDIQDYMFNVNVRINRLKGTSEDIIEIVPVEVLKEDLAFFKYMRESNNSLGRIQTNSLRKLKAFVKDTALMGHYDQADIRKQCLDLWKIPDQVRASSRVQDIDAKFSQLWKGSDDETCCSSRPTILTTQNLQNIKCIYDFKCIVSGGDRYFLLGTGRTAVYQWDGKLSYRSSRWLKLDKCKLELPKDTVLEVEIVQELYGEGRGQRRSTAIYILDAMMLGGLDVRDKHYSERMAIAKTFTEALRKPTRPDLVPLRIHHAFRMNELSSQVFSSVQMRLVKGRREPQECMTAYHERTAESDPKRECLFVPRGIYFIKHIQEPWTHHFSKSKQRLYFFNKQKHESRFECPKESIASFKTSLMSRYMWQWDRSSGLDSDSEEDLLDRKHLQEFIRATHHHHVNPS
ncbi:cap-specific mRNA (nucleoside-2'-O-)-methyltransferase 1 [Nematostella vectensis]|uniref:cap-specific mRNA (nucleoside-2'-O-)-methyltransferase 1 n=1 Tax=Nematostella vectensis TaxID=45351 RepID=UPI0013903AC8|nr:cap-specific mRNA (nucleoside-2'-O-)-methyltransferase 1 [Nematostella vectensis]